MHTFQETFTRAERSIRPVLEKYGFKLKEISVSEKEGSQWVYGYAHYVEKNNFTNAFSQKRVIRLSTAPLRLELDLDIGVGDSVYSIYEMHKSEGTGAFPQREHDLYKAMHHEKQLSSEFKRLVQVLIDCGSRFFANDTNLWDDLQVEREKNAEARENEQIFKNAEIAFKLKKWHEVINLLEGKQEILSKLNSGRLKYAQKMLNST